LRTARYNKTYREFDIGNRSPKYLRKKNLIKVGIGQGVGRLVKIRCGNKEEGNKYWLSEERRKCIFCRVDTDCTERYVDEYQK
ncbi:hypothetical protein ALC60_03126, partial [Trachymyrmex zeteki]